MTNDFIFRLSVRMWKVSGLIMASARPEQATEYLTVRGRRFLVWEECSPLFIRYRI